MKDFLHRLIFPFVPLYNKKSYEKFHHFNSSIWHTYIMALVHQHIQTTAKLLERGLRYGPFTSETMCKVKLTSLNTSYCSPLKIKDKFSDFFPACIFFFKLDFFQSCSIKNRICPFNIPGIFLKIYTFLEWNYLCGQ